MMQRRVEFMYFQNLEFGKSLDHHIRDIELQIEMKKSYYLEFLKNFSEKEIENEDGRFAVDM